MLSSIIRFVPLTWTITTSLLSADSSSHHSHGEQLSLRFGELVGRIFRAKWEHVMKMLIPLDGSKFAEDVLEPASRIARKMVAE